MISIEEIRDHFLKPRGLPDNLITETRRGGGVLVLDICGVEVTCGILNGKPVFAQEIHGFADFEQPGFIDTLLDSYQLAAFREENANLRAEIANLREENATQAARIEVLELSPDPGPRYLAAKERFDSAKDGKKS